MNTIRQCFAAAAVATVLLASQAVRADLALDPGFGTGGLAGVDFGTGFDSARDVAVQADGGLVLVGLSRQALAGTVFSYVGVARLLADGSPDPDFGVAGRVSLLPGGIPAASLNGGDGRAVLVQPDQRIVVAGAWNAGDGGPGQVFVLRLGTDGELDPGFGDGGVLLLTPPGLVDPVADGLALQSDGSIIVVGAGDAVAGLAGFVLRLTPGGVLDPTFADAGILTIPNTVANGLEFGLRAVTAVAGDALLVAGGGTDVFLARLDADGAFDPAFGTAGRLAVDLETLLSGGGTSVDDVFGFTLQSTGSIVLAGVRRLPDAQSGTPFLVRVLPDGSVDAGFGTGGVLDIPAPVASAAAFDVVALDDDALVTAGAGMPVVQVSVNGRAQFPLPLLGSGDLIVGLQQLPGNRVVGAGSRTRNPATRDTEFVAAVVTASALADVADTTPDPFTFNDVTGTVAPGSEQTSNTVTITGLTAPAPISVEGGEYQIGTGNFTAAPGLIQSGQTVTVRHLASLIGNKPTNTTLDIGGVTDTFTSVTAAGTVAAFDLGSRANVPLWTFQVSNTITVQGSGGAAGPFAISVSGGEGASYSVGCTGLFTAQAGQVGNGATVCVRHVSSTAGNTPVVSTLVIGGTAGTFTSTTVNVDSTPDAFSFAPLANAPIASVVQSAPVTISGIGSGIESLVRISGGEYSVGCTGTFTVGLGLIRNGQSVCVRHTTAGTSRGQVTTTLQVADVTGTFTSTTVDADLLPDRFEFASLTGVELVAPVTSAPVVITGITGPAEVTVSGNSGDEVSIGCTGTFTATPGRISNGQSICVRHTSSGSGERTVTTEVRVGGRVATFASTTRSADLVPDAFSIAPVTNAGLRQLVTSVPVTITGIDGPATIGVTGGGAYSVGCTGTFSLQLGTIRNGQTVCVRGLSGSTDGQSVEYLLGIGPPDAFTTGDTSFARPFVITTGDTTPDSFAFVNVVGVRQAVRVTSEPVTVTGITAPALISIFGTGEYSIGCSGNWTRADGTVSNGSTVCIRHISAPTLDTVVESELTVGGRWECTTGVLSQVDGRAVCVNAIGVPIAGARVRAGGFVSSTFTSRTSTETVPGSSAVDPWTLALLAPLAWLRRRRGSISVARRPAAVRAAG